MVYNDKFGKNAGILKEKKLFLLDMDGTVYEGERLFDETMPFLSAICSTGKKYVFITNNSSKSVNDYVKKLERMGICASDSDFFTSAQATALYIREKYPDRLVYVMGTRSLIEELERAGIKTTVQTTPAPDVILIGYDTELTYDKLIKTSFLLERYDLPYLATNPDKACPCEFGFVPDCAGMAQMLFMATGKRPYYIGKPETVMLDYCIAKYGCTNEETAIVGDRLYTDISAGNNAGVTSVCVLTGEAKMKDIVMGDIKPDVTLESVGDITNILLG